MVQADVNILIINPNTSGSMTDSIATAARAAAARGTIIDAVNPEFGPASIQGAQDGQAALPGLFATFERQVTQSSVYDAVVIACFDDTGLQELKLRAGIPVIGIGEAAFHTASMLGKVFSVVTTLPVSVPVIEENIAYYGFGQRCARVRASGVPVLALEDEMIDTTEIIRSESRRALEEDGCDAIVLGCAGMADLAEGLSQEFEVPVIDGVVAATTMCEALVRMKYSR